MTTLQFDSFSSVSWSRMVLEEPAADGPSQVVMSDAVADGPRLIGVGSIEWPDTGAPSAPGPPIGAVWTSSNGTTWTRVPHDDAVFRRAWVSSVTAGGPRFVAVGTSVVVHGRTRDAAVWTSPDGLTWSRVSHDETVFGQAAMYDVTTGGPGFVAVGFDGPPQTVDGTAAVWTSPDGISWSRVPHDPTVFEPQEWMSSVFAGGPGFVALGSRWHGPAEGSSTVMWTSPDGVTWSRVPLDKAVFGDAEVSGISAGGPGVVAVGEVGGDAAVWTSADGTTWSRVAHDEAVFGGAAETWMTSVARGGTGLVAVGGSSSGSGDRRAVVWTSPDGLTWSRVPHTEAIFGGRPEVEMTHVVVGEAGLVIIGVSGSVSEDYGATIWTATLEDG